MLNLNTPGTEDTPRRFVQALFDTTEGYDGDPKVIKAFDSECNGPKCHLSQIIEGPIPFVALCEHHALPFYGQAHVSYIAHDRIIGISKLTRLVVKLFARRFAVQERIGNQIADALQAVLKPHGVAVYLEARHLCVEMRGVREMSPITRTTFWRGEFTANASLLQEFLSLSGTKRSSGNGTSQ